MQDHKFTPGDFLSFLRSISHQSATLTVVFRESIAAEQRCNSLASFKASDFQEATPAPAHLAWGSEAVGAIPAIRISSEPSARSPSSSPGVVDAAPAGAMVDVNDKPEEAMDMTAKLITRRRIEATRRQVSPPLLHTLGRDYLSPTTFPGMSLELCEKSAF